MTDSERWRIVDHYLFMIQILNTQSRNIYTSQHELYERLSELIQSIRTPEIPRRNRVSPHVVNQPTYRSGHRMSSTSMPLHRRAREPDNNRQGVSSTTTRLPSRESHPRSQTEPLSNTSSPNVNGEEDIGVNEESRARIPRTPASSGIRTHLNMRQPILTEIESTFPAVSFTGVNTSSPFSNIINSGIRLPQPPIHDQMEHMTTPFNFFSNVPVFPTPEEISDATRIISFDTIEDPINDQCPITMAPFNHSDIVTQIVHCGHIFDVVHLNGWFRTNVRCPVCRHDIRDVGVAGVGVNTDDLLSTLAPESFVADGYETDPDMPPLVPSDPADPVDPEQNLEPVTNGHTLSEPNNASNMDTHILNGTIESINITDPIWRVHQFHQSSDTSSNQFVSDIQNAITTQGLDLIANVITQSIRGSFQTPSTPEPAPTPDAEDTELNH